MIDTTMQPSGAGATSDVSGGVPVEGTEWPLRIRQLYLGCLSQASYIVGDLSTGRAIAIDPRRDIDEILWAATTDGLSIELVVETHFHADFLSGHLELAAATDSKIALGAAASTQYPAMKLAHGDEIVLGSVVIEVISTPGHTPESICLAVRSRPDGDVEAVLTGDTLFIGDVGRPDLLASDGVSPSHMAESLYESTRILKRLPDTALVLPAHGAGSACGKMISRETISTIGDQKKTNYALQNMTKQEFVDLVIDELPAQPQYFSFSSALNRQTRPLFKPKEPVPDVGLDMILEQENGVAILDTRPTNEFSAGHLRGSIGISLSGRFAEQAGSLIDPYSDIVLVGTSDQVDEARTRLGRIGFDRVAGAIPKIEEILTNSPGLARQLSRVEAIQVDAIFRGLEEEVQFVDVRNPREVASATVQGATNIPLADLVRRLDELDPNRPVLLICASGQRSAVASSFLSSRGFSDVTDVIGGARAVLALA